MKQLLFLLLFPCLCVAQYTGNAGQKITLGEQTSADGLVWRGRLADTANLLTNKLDTSVYIVLDTGTRAMWYYRASTTPKWTRLVDSLNNMQGQLSLTTKVTGVLPVANGGTGQSTLAANKVMVGNGTSGVLTPTNLHWDNTYSRLGIGTASPLSSLNIQDGSLYIGSSTNTSQTQNILFSYGYNFNGTPLGVSKITSTYNNNNASASLEFYTSPPSSNPIERIFIATTGEIGLGMSTPTAVVQIKAGTTSSNTAPLKFTSGTNLTTVEAGAMEFNGTNLFFSPSTTRHTVNHGLTGSATLDFLSTNTQSSIDMTIAVTGAADGDVVSLGVPNTAVNANTSYSAWVSAPNTVTVRFNNYSSGTVDPASALFKVFVTK